MIAKGKIRGEGGKLALYLMTGENGERAQLVEARGLDAFGGEPVAAFEAMEAFAQAHTRCKLPFFHEQIRVAPNERLTEAQWMEAVDRSEKRLGFTGQPRLVSFHINEATGEKHLHAAWFRVDFESERAIDPGMFKNHLKQLSRKLERDFSIRELSNDRPAERRARAAERKEFEESRRLKTDVNALRTAILDCYRQSDSGKAFRAALEGQGLELANGDRRDCFVVIDQAGGHHALNKKLTGQTLAATRDKLADLDRNQLPGVEQAKALQAERHPEAAQEPRRQAPPSPGVENHPAAASGPYVELRAAQTESQFAAQAERTTEAAAPVWDRDADNAAWEARLADAAQVAAEARQPAKHGRGVERDRPAAEGRYAPLQMPEPAPEAKAESELRGTAAEIRLAWALSRTASDLEDGLAARGIGLARVSAGEAYASERRAALAKEAGNVAPLWREGEIVAVDGFGSVYRLTERTTGDGAATVAGKLAGIDRAALMDVAAAQEAMRAASLEAWKAERRAEREMDRPASAIEAAIAGSATDAAAGVPAVVLRDAEGRTVNRAEALGDRMRNEDERSLAAVTVTGAAAFFARLDDAGIAVCRVTAADEPALAALRRAEELKAQTAEANGESYQGNRLADVLPGELAAVTRHGDVYRLNPDKLGEAEPYLAAAALPGVIEARDRFAAERADIETHWQLKRAGIEADRAAWQDARAINRAAATGERAVQTVFETPAAAAGKTLRKGGKAARLAEKLFEGLFGTLFGAFMAPPKDTPAQTEQKVKAATNEETLRAEAYAAAKAERAARMDALLNQMARDDEIRRVQDYSRTGGAGGYDRPAGPREGGDYERERER